MRAVLRQLVKRPSVLFDVAAFIKNKVQSQQVKLLNVQTSLQKT